MARGICGPGDLRRYQVVVAATREMGIGRDGKLPWSLPGDLRFFKELTSTTTTTTTKKNAVLMGRRTWESIPSKYRPLPGRLNVVLSRSGLDSVEGALVCESVPSALRLLAEEPHCSSVERVFVIGGGQILRETLNGDGCDAIHITEIETSIACDTFVPAIDPLLYRRWYSSPPVVENGIRYRFTTYVRAGIGACRDGGSAAVEAGKFEGCADRVDPEDVGFLPKMILEKRDRRCG